MLFALAVLAFLPNGSEVILGRDPLCLAGGYSSPDRSEEVAPADIAEDSLKGACKPYFDDLSVFSLDRLPDRIEGALVLLYALHVHSELG